ncbi:MAG: O-antigen ligase family protein [Bacteroidota bacterium]
MLAESVHRNIFLFGLFLIAIGLSVGAIFLSLGIIIVSGNWLIEGNYSNKIYEIKTNKFLWVFLSFFFLHIIGLLWSDDLYFGGNDIKVKLPLFALPLVFATTKKLNEAELKSLLIIYLLGIFFSTLWSMVFFLGLRNLEANDVRGISRFYSHIRFSMNIVYGIFISIYLSANLENKINKILIAICGVWFTAFLFILSSLTGIVFFLILLLLLLFYLSLHQKNKNLKFILIGTIISFVALPAIYLISTYNYFFPIIEQENSKLEQWTPAGDLYFHEKDLSRENGYFVWRHISYKELESSWNKKSKINFNDLDQKGNSIKFTLIRYMTSLGLKKDSLSFTKLQNQDIKNIENGTPNYKLSTAGTLQKRVYDMFWEMNDYLNYGHLRNHSIMVRVLYWKTAWKIIKENAVFGVGIGDIQVEFEKHYLPEKVFHSRSEMRRAHNQYIEIWATLGIFGLLLLLILTFYPLIKSKDLHVLFLPIGLILMFSMFTEDTLETQAGVSLFAFFIPFFVFLVHRDAKADITS